VRELHETVPPRPHAFYAVPRPAQAFNRPAQRVAFSATERDAQPYRFRVRLGERRQHPCVEVRVVGGVVTVAATDVGGVVMGEAGTAE